MKSKLLLRVAAILILIHLLGHSVGHSGWDRPKDPKMQEVVTVMKSYKGEFMGATQSMADYYNGYSLMMFVLYGMSIILLWLLSRIVKEHPVITGNILYTVGTAYLIFGVIEFVYFFPFAGAMSFFAGVLTLVAVAVARK
jgi:hypothetical protein